MDQPTSHHHSKARETPVPVYLGLYLHSKTRKRELIDNMFNLGLSISYDRVLALSTSLGNAVCELYTQDGVVCPPNLRPGLFTVAAADNVDHNPSSSTAEVRFHGTGISLYQYPATEKEGKVRQRHELLDSSTKGLKALPQFYTNVPPVVPKKEYAVPVVNESMAPTNNILTDALAKEERYI